MIAGLLQRDERGQIVQRAVEGDGMFASGPDVTATDQVVGEIARALAIVVQ